MVVASRKTAKKNSRTKKSNIKSVKKSVNNKGSKVTRVIHESTKEIKVDRALVDNFIGLQKVMVNLSSKFDSLSTQISKLLELFEISAKALVKKEFETEKESDNTHAIMNRLDNIAQQAGLIGRGLELIKQINDEKRSELGGNEGSMIREAHSPRPPQPPLPRPIPNQRPPQLMKSAPMQNTGTQPNPNLNQKMSPQLSSVRSAQKPSLESVVNQKQNGQQGQNQKQNEKKMP